MASMRDIKTRITATKKTSQITNAMYMVSASKLKKAERSILGYRPLMTQMEGIINGILQDSDVTHEMLQTREVKKTCYILVSSDRGLAGPYNSSVFKKFKAHIEETHKSNNEFVVVPLGFKAHSFVRRSNYQMLSDEVVNIRDDIQFVDFKETTNTFINTFLSNKVDKIVVFYNKFINTISQEVHIHQLLPIELQSDVKTSKVYKYEPSKDEIIDSLLPMYVENSLYGLILEAKASEHASRMTAMKSATDNATDIIKTLQLHYNRARQAAITIELTDIIGGANAVK